MSKNFELLQRMAKNNFSRMAGEIVSSPLNKPPAELPFKRHAPDVEIVKLVQRLFGSDSKGAGPRAVSFSGIERDDRSSWICARAGDVLADQVDGSVCVVETSLLSSRSHMHASPEIQQGLAEALVSKAPIRSFAVPVSGGNLWVIPAGMGRPGLHSSTDRYRERFAELREAFDYILISAPPLVRETEATFIGQLVDGVVLIVEANQTRRDTLRRSKEQLEGAQVRLLGAVLDQRTFPIPEKIYRRL
jgi:receptor protein-tyrosine kinase